jgi:hypothetical protein
VPTIAPTNSPAFSLGQTVMTASIHHLISSGKLHPLAPNLCINRHVRCDWAECEAEDADLNAQALRDGERIVSWYTVNGIKLMIVTEADRSSTTVLLPEDY